MITEREICPAVTSISHDLPSAHSKLRAQRETRSNASTGGSPMPPPGFDVTATRRYIVGGGRPRGILHILRTERAQGALDKYEEFALDRQAVELPCWHPIEERQVGVSRSHRQPLHVLSILAEQQRRHDAFENKEAF